MRNRNGYSLIELLAAIIIIGLILLFVIPAAVRLITNNDAKEYSNYLKIVETGAKGYADDKKDDLGYSNDAGCIEVSIDTLIEEEYIKKFDNANIICSGKARINNNKGKLGVSINLTCTDKDGKETYKNEKISADTCEAFVPREEKALKNQIIKNGVGTGTITTYYNKQYISGRNANNYVWYSGHLWRIVYYDEEVVKMVSTDIATVMPKGNEDINYTNSLVDKWLNEVYLKTLKDYDTYLIDSTWDVSQTAASSFYPNGSEVITSKIGLLNSYETVRMSGGLASQYKWLLSNYVDSKIRTSKSGGSGSVSQETYNKDKYYAIRPAITMKADVYVIAGNGSRNLPYVLEGNSANIARNTLLNTRYSGEYLKINNNLYRIVEIDNELTKVIKVEALNERQYADDNDKHNYSYSLIYEYLKNDWYVNDLGSDKKLIYANGSWCGRQVSTNLELLSSCEGDTITAPVGLPSLGDVLTANNDDTTDNFWTIDYAGEGIMNVISVDTKTTESVLETAQIKPVMYLKSNVIITSGNGTHDNPFVLDLK